MYTGTAAQKAARASIHDLSVALGAVCNCPPGAFAADPKSVDVVDDDLLLRIKALALIAGQGR